MNFNVARTGISLVCTTVLFGNLLLGCDDKPNPPTNQISASDDIQACETFYDLWHTRRLVFEPNSNRVTFTEVMPSSGSADIDNATHVRTVIGTYAVSNHARIVVVTLGGIGHRYTELGSEPPAPDCSLLDGSMDAVNLTMSWFGAIEPPDEDEMPVDP